MEEIYTSEFTPQQQRAHCRLIDWQADAHIILRNEKPTLLIDQVSFGTFDSCTAAAEHLIALVNTP